MWPRGSFLVLSLQTLRLPTSDLLWRVDLFFNLPPVAAVPQESGHWPAGGRIRTERQSGIASVNWTRLVKPTDATLRHSWRCVRLSEARGVTWRLADASSHEDASLNVQAFENELTLAQCSSFIFRVFVNNEFYIRKLEVRLSQNTALVFAKCEKATRTGPSMARRRAFRIWRPFPFPAGCFRQKRM